LTSKLEVDKYWSLVIFLRTLCDFIHVVLR
jgi:hypothetical protein